MTSATGQISAHIILVFSIQREQLPGSSKTGFRFQSSDVAICGTFPKSHSVVGELVFYQLPDEVETIRQINILLLFIKMTFFRVLYSSGSLLSCYYCNLLLKTVSNRKPRYAIGHGTLWLGTEQVSLYGLDGRELS